MKTPMTDEAIAERPIIICVRCGETAPAKLSPKGKATLPRGWTLADDEPMCPACKAAGKASMALSYAAKPPHEKADAVFAQIRLAHRYRNALVEIERRRRERSAALILERSPELAEAQKRADDATAAIEAAQAAFTRSQVERGNRRGDPELAQALADARKARREAYAALKTAKAEAFADPTLKPDLQKIDQQARDEHKAARAQFNQEHGLYWSTGLIVDDSMRRAKSGAPPRFLRFTGEGSIAVQLQGGRSLEQLTAGTDRQARLILSDDSHWATLHLRIGTKDGQPVWTAARISLRKERRLPPDDASIKQITLHRRRDGVDWQWSATVNYTAAAEPPPAPTTDSHVAVNLGWRVVPGGLRVAYWVDSDGREGELIIPERDYAPRQRGEKLQGVRDVLADGMRRTIAACLAGESAPDWLAAQAEFSRKNADQADHRVRDRLMAIADDYARLADRFEPPAQLPDWWAERTTNFHLWKKQDSLRRLVEFWRDHRFDGDDVLFGAVLSWYRQDTHLARWISGERNNAIKRRDQLFGGFVQAMRHYQTVHLAAVDYAAMQRTPVKEKQSEQDRIVALYRRFAAAGELHDRLTRKCRTELHSPQNITRRCHACGSIEQIDGSKLTHVCQSCARRWDIDANAARNLLASASATVA